jgi:hypothetical protein
MAEPTPIPWSDRGFTSQEEFDEYARRVTQAGARNEGTLTPGRAKIWVEDRSKADMDRFFDVVIQKPVKFGAPAPIPTPKPASVPRPTPAPKPTPSVVAPEPAPAEQPVSHPRAVVAPDTTPIYERTPAPAVLDELLPRVAMGLQLTAPITAPT